MLRKIPRAVWIALPLAYFLYFWHLGAVGMFGPDEPRYASIGREMARSGDWITPRLWGEPWFEKPALLYWMTGAGFRAGLGDDLAPRLPVALLSVAFLAFYWWILYREFGCRASTLATLILGATAGWLGFSQVGVTDLPLAATFSAAMLLAIPWVSRRDTRFLPAVAALLAFGVLAKSLPALILAAPLAWRWRWWRDLVKPRVIAPFLIIALPWHVLCFLRNGRAFTDTLFLQQQFGRFISGALMHGRPWWFYLPVLAGLLLPWTPLLFLAARRAAEPDPRRRFLLAWSLFGLIFFSAAANKLPGYVLPLLPALAALMAISLDEARSARWWLACCALALIAFPVAAPILPAIVANGLSRAPRPNFQWTWTLPLALAAIVWFLEGSGRRVIAAACISLGVAGAMVYVKTSAAPELNRVASARGLWIEIAARSSQVCVANLNRDWRYGLNYYSVIPLPDCSDVVCPIWLVQKAGAPPYVVDLPRASIVISRSAFEQDKK